MSADGGGVYEVAFALEERRDVTKELPREAIYPCEGIFEVSRLLPDDSSLWYDFVDLHCD